MVARLLLILALLLSAPAAAKDGPSSLEGSWALEISGTVIFRFDLEKDADSGEWHGNWSRPESFASDGNHFAQIKMPATVKTSMTGIEDGDEVEVSFNDTRPGAIPDIFRFQLIDPDAAEMTYVGTGLAPYAMQRVAADTPLGPFEDGAVYARRLPRASEPEVEQDEGPADIPAPPPGNLNDFHLPPDAPTGR